MTKRTPAARAAARKGPKTRVRAGRGSKAAARAGRAPKRAEHKVATGESLEARQARFHKILPLLHRTYPEADCALHHGDAFELLVATILSAQSTDETVNKVTPVLFAEFPTPQAMASAPLEHIERIIHSTGFFRQKARSLQGTARAIVERFGGRVPDSLEELVTLPGVARKTANVVLGTHFKKNEGVVVDTHVGRVGTRLGLTWNARDGKDAVKIEKDLMQVVPRGQWTYVGHALIWHGRKICLARKPKCDACPLAELCPSAPLFR